MNGYQRMLKIIASTTLVLLVILGTGTAIEYYEPNEQEAVQEANNQSEAKALDILASERVAYYTKVLSIFTGALSALGLLQIFFLIRTDKTARTGAEAAKASAEAAKLNAEALIDADRAHLWPVIKANNLGAALRAANVVDMDDRMAEPRPFVRFALKNLGRAAAIMEESGWLLTQRERGNRVWDYPIGAIAEPVVDGGAETTPPTDCTLESVFRVRDAKAAFDDSRPLYFVGYVIFTTSLDRTYEFRWQYENSGTRWLLRHYEERQRPEYPPDGPTTGTLSFKPNSP